MAFEFPKDNEPRSVRTNRAIMKQVESYSPIYQSQKKRETFNGNGRWGLVIYYYFLEKLLTQLRKDLKYTENEWKTSIWEEASKLVEEPEDIIEGLKKLQPICQRGCEEVLEDLANAIQLLTAIKAFEEK
ncbi:hypothetical protein SAMN05216463_10817 [Xylanibacter ruminicola]|jgi:hypothetical protein|uniref:Uncharacterized protein n=2 Tax=Xylanibacter ruminicola TaxID=839 RepID=A0A1M6U4U8_XYLRU|nr:hypothetical protein SAMN05216463_10817 [Xylanibacter ruminicola]